MHEYNCYCILIFKGTVAYQLLLSLVRHCSFIQGGFITVPPNFRSQTCIQCGIPRYLEKHGHWLIWRLAMPTAVVIRLFETFIFASNRQRFDVGCGQTPPGV